jgi:hypothetical protein
MCVLRLPGSAIADEVSGLVSTMVQSACAIPSPAVVGMAPAVVPVTTKPPAPTPSAAPKMSDHDLQERRRSVAEVAKALVDDILVAVTIPQPAMTVDVHPTAPEVPVAATPSLLVPPASISPQVTSPRQSVPPVAVGRQPVSAAAAPVATKPVTPKSVVPRYSEMSDSCHQPLVIVDVRCSSLFDSCCHCPIVVISR